MATIKSKKNILQNPRVTEKAATALEHNVYTFDVAKSANKNEVRQAVFAQYKVKPVRVNILSVPKKHIMTRGKEGTRGGGKKALVYLKKEDKIEFI